MTDRFKPLECNDDDVVLFNNSLVKFAQFKDDLKNKFRANVEYLFTKQNNRCGTREKIFDLTYTSFGDCDISMTFSSPREGKDCEILRLGSKSWQKGKLRTQAFIEFFPEVTKTEDKAKIHITLEFCPDEPEIPQPQSPLDDLRQIINETNI